MCVSSLDERSRFPMCRSLLHMWRCPYLCMHMCVRAQAHRYRLRGRRLRRVGFLGLWVRACCNQYVFLWLDACLRICVMNACTYVHIRMHVCCRFHMNACAHVGYVCITYYANVHAHVGKYNAYQFWTAGQPELCRHHSHLLLSSSFPRAQPSAFR